jgi:hypothetical protein
VTDSTGDSFRDDIRTLHEHLVATGELPVDTPASHYLGEAEAVVTDALRSGTPRDVVRQRVEQARALLAEVESVEDDVAREHVEAARDLCDEILAP